MLNMGREEGERRERGREREGRERGEKGTGERGGRGERGRGESLLFDVLMLFFRCGLNSMCTVVWHVRVLECSRVRLEDQVKGVRCACEYPLHCQHDKLLEG